MGNTGEDVDTSSPMKIEKKKKKNKNMINDGDGDGNTHLNEKLHNHTKKKRKKSSESNEDVEENGDIQKNRKRETKNYDDPKVKKDKKKKRELESNEDVDLQKKKKRNDSSEETQTKENELTQDDDPNLEKHKKKKKKSKSNEDGGDTGNNLEHNGDLKKKKKYSSENSRKRKTKKVTFSSDVEIFPPSKPKKPRKTNSDDNLVRGKKFTPEEDEIVKQAVEDYIISNNLGDDDLKVILNCKSHKGMSRCWQKIGTCIPYRPYISVYCRAHILFEQSEHRQWSPEEINFLKESYKKHGKKWKMIADELGKHRLHVRDTWRRTNSIIKNAGNGVKMSTKISTTW